MHTKLRLVSAFLACVATGHASSGPVTNLIIANKMLAPDGFSRNTVLANGTFPGPTISGFQVIKSLFMSVPS